MLLDTRSTCNVDYIFYILGKICNIIYINIKNQVPRNKSDPENGQNLSWKTRCRGQHCELSTPCLATLPAHVGVPGRELVAKLLIQLVGNVPGKEAEDGLNTWAPATHLGEQDGVLGFWLQPGSDQVAVVI